MTRVFHGVTYRCVQRGVLVEEVTVPLGGYEDTRLGLEVLDGRNGWQRVSPGAAGEAPEASGDDQDAGVAEDGAATPEPEVRREQDPEPAHEDEDTQEGGE